MGGGYEGPGREEGEGEGRGESAPVAKRGGKVVDPVKILCFDWGGTIGTMEIDPHTMDIK
jgi:hypothetical protein